MTIKRLTSTTVLLSALGLLVAACGAEATPAAATEATATTAATAETTTTVGETTTTDAATTTTDISPELRVLLDQGYTWSEDYVVETVVRDIDSGTGGLAIDANGVFYQADFGYPGNDGNTVYRVRADGTVEEFVQSEEMGSLTMTTFGADGKLYQSSYGTGKVFAIEEGAATLVAEGLRGPTGIVVLEDGTMFVESYSADLVHKVTPDGTISDWATHPEFDGPNGLTAGPDGTLYAVNHKDGGLFSIDPDGNVTLLHDFPWPTSHVAYLDDSLFVTSRGIFIVYRYDLATGEVEIIAGDTTPGDKDGRGMDSSFGRPNAITAGPDGALYINHGDGSDNSPVSIRRITYQPES